MNKNSYLSYACEVFYTMGMSHFPVKPWSWNKITKHLLISVDDKIQNIVK